MTMISREREREGERGREREREGETFDRMTGLSTESDTLSLTHFSDTLSLT